MIMINMSILPFVRVVNENEKYYNQLIYELRERDRHNF